MQITGIQADQQLNVRKPIKIRKELKSIAIFSGIVLYSWT
jgi:hypothetical protein